MKTIYTFLTLLFSMTIFAQSSKELAIFGGANYQPILKGHQFGGDLTGRYYVSEKLSLGLGFAYSTKKYREGFGYETDRTLTHNVLLNSVVQYDFLSNENFSVGAYFLNGVSLVTLRNLNDTKTRTVNEEIDGIWYWREVEVPKRLNRDAFYVMTPGIDFSVKVANLDPEFDTKMYITSRIGYQMAFGNQDFATAKNYTDFVFSLGITIRTR